MAWLDTHILEWLPKPCNVSMPKILASVDGLNVTLEGPAGVWPAGFQNAWQGKGEDKGAFLALAKLLERSIEHAFDRLRAFPSGADGRL